MISQPRIDDWADAAFSYVSNSIPNDLVSGGVILFPIMIRLNPDTYAFDWKTDPAFIGIPAMDSQRAVDLVKIGEDLLHALSRFASRLPEEMLIP